MLKRRIQTQHSSPVKRFDQTVAGIPVFAVFQSTMPQQKTPGSHEVTSFLFASRNRTGFLVMSPFRVSRPALLTPPAVVEPVINLLPLVVDQEGVLELETLGAKSAITRHAVVEDRLKFFLLTGTPHLKTSPCLVANRHSLLFVDPRNTGGVTDVFFSLNNMEEHVGLVAGRKDVHVARRAVLSSCLVTSGMVSLEIPELASGVVTAQTSKLPEIGWISQPGEC